MSHGDVLHSSRSTRDLGEVELGGVDGACVAASASASTSVMQRGGETGAVGAVGAGASER